MTKEASQPLRGMRDILSRDALAMQMVVQTSQKIAKSYGYHLMETPLLESTNLFARGLGESTDVVGKEMYSFLDKNEASISLRPEMTAGIVRAAITHSWHQHLPVRAFYRGAMFRRERPQKGRYRQFHQIGIEALGAGDGKNGIYNDVEIMMIGYKLLKALGLENDVVLQVNSLGSSNARKRYREELRTWLLPKRNELSVESLKRLDSNPLRILDSKSEQDQQILAEAPSIDNSWDEESKIRYDGVLAMLTNLGVNFGENRKLVRGLDYYCHTIFEFVKREGGSQGTVIAGGCYDGLAELLGGNAMTGAGWAGGIERLVAMVQAKQPAEVVLDKVCILPLGDTTAKQAQIWAESWRNAGLEAVTIWQQKLKKGLKTAARMGVTYVILLGENELATEKVLIKDMITGEQTAVAVTAVVDYLQSRGI